MENATRRLAEKVRVELIAVAAQAVSSSDCAEPCYDENGFTEVKRGGYSECAELALKSLEGYLRALDGEHARHFAERGRTASRRGAFAIDFPL